MSIIDGMVQSVESNRMPDRSEKLRVTVSYQAANIIGNLTFDVPFAEAPVWCVGMAVRIQIESSWERRDDGDA